MSFIMEFPVLLIATLFLASAAPVFSADAADTGLLTPVHEFGVHMTVDQSGKPKSPAPGDVIFQPRLTRDNGKPLTAEELTRVKYTSLDLPEWLQLDSKTGEVKVRDAVVGLPTAKSEPVADGAPPPPHMTGASFKFNLTGEENANSRVPPERMGARPVMAKPHAARVYVHINVSVEGDGDNNCDKLCTKEGNCPAQCIRNACFWERSDFQVWENQPAIQLGTLGPGGVGLGGSQGGSRLGGPKDANDCRAKLKYTLVNGTSYAKLEEDEKMSSAWLWTREKLDRDFVTTNGSGPGPLLKLQVRCESQCKAAAPEDNMVQITVLDENDNQPESQEGPNAVRCFVSKKKDNPTGKLTCPKLIINDLDSKSANNKNLFKVNDPENYVRLDQQHIFALDYLGFPTTAMRFDMVPTKQLDLSKPHTFQLIVNDTSVGYGKEKALIVNITLQGNQTEVQGDQAATPAGLNGGLPSTLRVSRDAPPPPVYPGAVRVSRSAGMFSRLAQPAGPVADLAFGMGGAGAKAGLEVTRDGGIVYVSDTAKLRAADDLLRSQKKTG